MAQTVLFQLWQIPIHWAVMLKAKEGREKDLENAFMSFLRRSLGQYGSTGAHLVRPRADADEREFLLHRSFLSKEHSRQFYESDLYREYQDSTAELIEGPARIRALNGFSLSFAEPLARLLAGRWPLSHGSGVFRLYQSGQ